MNKERFINEVELKIKEVEADQAKLNASSEDADTIGTENEMAKETLRTLEFIKTTIKNWPENDKWDMTGNILDAFNRFICDYPLTKLNSLDDNPDEYTSIDMVNVNKRYSPLIRMSEDKYYTDFNRVKYYDILSGSEVYHSDFKKINIKLLEKLDEFIDKTWPIEFPYDPVAGRVKVYIEILSSPLQDGHEAVNSICIQAVQRKVDGKRKVEKVMRFFDICESGALDEIDRKTYVNRWQIYHDYIDRQEREKANERWAQIKAAEEIVEKGITDPTEMTDILNVARNEDSDSHKNDTI